MDLRPPQRLVGIDVADAGDDALVQQHPLDRAVTGLDPPHDRGLVVDRLERVGGDVPDLVGHTVVAELVEGEPTEGSLVDEARARVRRRRR